MPRAVDGVKECSRCKVSKPVEAFSRDKNRLDGRHHRCKECYKQSNVSRRSRLKCTYGMTPEDYDRMLDAQQGMCAAHQGPPRDGKPLVVDHDHETGRVRALICGPCNLILGLAGEHHLPLYGVALYLEVYCGK